MRWLAAIACALGVPACDLAFGLSGHHADAGADAADAPIDAPPLDLDEDGFPDDADPCIASPEDGAADFDGDTVRNDLDPCPFNATGVTDADSDGIPDSCDPFTNQPGDRSRCVMVFAKTKLATRLWLPRTGDAPWTPSPGKLDAFASTGRTTVIAAESLEGESITSYHGVFTFAPGAQPGSLTLWLRANPDMQTTADVGCRIQTGNSMDVVGVIGPSGIKDTHPISAGASNTIRMVGSIVTTGTTSTITCRFAFNGAPPVFSTQAEPLVPGRVGLTSEHWQATIIGLHVLDHP